MSAQGVIRFPERTSCVECGTQLEPGAAECPSCFPDPWTGPPVGVFHDIEVHLRRSRARLLFGLVLFPLVLPWAVLSARRAGAAYRRQGSDDRALDRRIRRHLLGSIIVNAGWLTVFLLALTG